MAKRGRNLLTERHNFRCVGGVATENENWVYLYARFLL